MATRERRESLCCKPTARRGARRRHRHARICRCDEELAGALERWPGARVRNLRSHPRRDAGFARLRGSDFERPPFSVEAGPRPPAPAHPRYVPSRPRPATARDMELLVQQRRHVLVRRGHEEDVARAQVVADDRIGRGGRSGAPRRAARPRPALLPARQPSPGGPSKSTSGGCPRSSSPPVLESGADSILTSDGTAGTDAFGAALTHRAIRRAAAPGPVSSRPGGSTRTRSNVTRPGVRFVAELTR
jgi:hypothetical protein